MGGFFFRRPVKRTGEAGRNGMPKRAAKRQKPAIPFRERLMGPDVEKRYLDLAKAVEAGKVRVSNGTNGIPTIDIAGFGNLTPQETVFATWYPLFLLNFSKKGTQGEWNRIRNRALGFFQNVVLLKAMPWAVGIGVAGLPRARNEYGTVKGDISAGNAMAVEEGGKRIRTGETFTSNSERIGKIEIARRAGDFFLQHPEYIVMPRMPNQIYDGTKSQMEYGYRKGGGTGTVGERIIGMPKIEIPSAPRVEWLPKKVTDFWNRTKTDAEAKWNAGEKGITQAEVATQAVRDYKLPITFKSVEAGAISGAGLYLGILSAILGKSFLKKIKARRQAAQSAKEMAQLPQQMP